MDESGAWPGLVRRYARSPKGTRAVDDTPRRKDGKVSLTAVVTLQGLDPERCLIHPGAVDTTAFPTYLREVLVPALKPEQVIFMGPNEVRTPRNNFTIHHNKDVRTLIGGAGCYLAHLPTYSPDFNPIELVFSKIKAFLKKARAIRVVDLIMTVAEAITTVSPQEVERCFSHCGYL